MKTKFLLALIAILFVAVLYLLFLNLQKPLSITYVPPTPTLIVKAEKEYSNSKFGLSFSYPSSMELSENDDANTGMHIIDMFGVGFSGSDGYQANNMLVRIVPTQIQPVGKICFPPKSLDCYSLADAKKVIVGGKVGLQFEPPIPEPGGYSKTSKVRIILVENNGYLYSISQQRLTSNENDFLLSFGQILSTLNFTGQEKTNLQKPEIGFIKNIYLKNNLKYIDVDYIQWINDNTAPNGYRIVNDNSVIRTLKVSDSATLTVIDWTDQGQVTPQISFSELQRIFTHTSANYDIKEVDQKPFDIEFNQTGQISKISLRYTP